MTQGLTGVQGYNQPVYGSGNSVVGGTSDQTNEAAQGGLSGLWQMITGTGPNIQGPNADAYDQLLQTAQMNAEQDAANAGSYTQAGATIANPYQAQSQAQLANTQKDLSGVGSTLMQTAQGRGPAITAAQNQMTQATDQSIAAQTAMARSATGGPLTQNAAQMQALGNNASTLGTAASQTQQNLANQELQAAQAAGSVYGTAGQLGMSQYGLEQGTAQQQAQLQQQNQGQINAQQMGYLQASQNEENNQQNALNSYTQDNLAAQGVGLSAAGQASTQGGNALGTLATVAGTVAMAASDERLKEDIESEGDTPRGSLADSFLAQLHPASFSYKDEQDEPGPSHGGRYLGVMAQALRATPEVGAQLIVDTPRGLHVEPRATLMAALAGLGRLHERVAQLEGGKRAR